MDSHKQNKSTSRWFVRKRPRAGRSSRRNSHKCNRHDPTLIPHWRNRCRGAFPFESSRCSSYHRPMGDDVSGPPRSSHPWVFAVATLAVLATVNFLHEILAHFAAYRALYERHAFYVPEGIDKIGGVIVCGFAVWTLRRVGWRGIACELGLAPSPLPALVFALVASSPMLIGFALTRGVTPHMEPVSLVFLTVLSPIAEEIEFRGLGARNLQRGTGWPFWLIVWPQALLFGWGH